MPFVFNLILRPYLFRNPVLNYFQVLLKYKNNRILHYIDKFQLLIDLFIFLPPNLLLHEKKSGFYNFILLDRMFFSGYQRGHQYLYRPGISFRCFGQQNLCSGKQHHLENRKHEWIWFFKRNWLFYKYQSRFSVA